MSRIIPLAAAAATLLLGGCELGPKQSQQTGFRGTGMAQIVDPDHVVKLGAIPPPPYALPDDSGKRVGGDGARDEERDRDDAQEQ